MPEIFTHSQFRPPESGNILKRIRLFKVLDAAREHPLIWIGSAAGSGKTSLVASYLKEKKQASVWYQIDEGDRDIGSFFYYFELACKNIRNKKRTKLPLFTQEYQYGLKAFARNYFRELFCEIKSSIIIVLDNYNNVTDDRQLNEVLLIAVDELPGSSSIIVNSRNGPPSETARLTLSNKLAKIEWAAMQLTFDETLSLSKKHIENKDITHAHLKKIHQHSQGWAMGLVLLLENRKNSPVTTNQWDLKNKNNISSLALDYFSEEITKSINSETMVFLMKISLLPVITASSARRLSEISDAKSILNKLVHQHFFVTRRGTIKPTYEFHPLFQQFLLNKFHDYFSPEKIKSLKYKAGKLLIKTGHIEDAALLFIKNRSWPELESLIIKNAKKFINQGRYETTEFWIRSMPERVISTNPDLLLWLGNAILQTRPTQARTYIQDAYKLFLKQNNSTGSYLAWANIIDSHIFAWDTFESIPYWLNELSKLQKKQPFIIDIETRIRVSFSAFSAMMHVAPDHPKLPAWLNRVEKIFRFVPIEFIRPMAGAQLSYYHVFMGNMEKHHDIIINIESLEATGKLPPLPRLYSLITCIFYHLQKSDIEKTEEYQIRCKNLSESSGVHCFNFLLSATTVLSSGLNNDLKETQKRLKILKNLILPERHLDHTLYLHLLAWNNLLCGNIDEAYRQSRHAHTLVVKLRAEFPIRLNELLLAQIYTKQKNYKAAQANASRTTEFAIKIKSSYFEFMGFCTLGWIYLITNRIEQADNFISHALKAGRHQGIFCTHIWNPEMMSAICLRALETGTEPDYVKEIIYRRKLTPGNSISSLSNWPWALKIYTFGEFYIEQNGIKLITRGKAQLKPLSLLKALIAHGGYNVSSTILKESLWPDAEGDYAQQNYKTVLSRLRKLIGAEYLHVSGGNLSLNKDHVWVDTWAFKSYLNSPHSEELLHDKFTRLRQLYRGCFLQNEDQAWILQARYFFKSSILKTLKLYSQKLIQQGEILQATQILEAGLEIDRLDEDLYTSLMQCQLALGHNSELAITYKKCVYNLKEYLQVQPSDTTKRLYEQVELDINQSKSCTASKLY